MKKDEYVTTIVVGDNLIPVGINDVGQTYFFEYVDKNTHELKEECCGSYNTHFTEYIEYKFGEPEKDCSYYETMELHSVNENCPNNTKFGFCDKCEFQNREWSHFQKLVELGIIDRRGNIMEAYKPYLVKRDVVEEAVKEND